MSDGPDAPVRVLAQRQSVDEGLLAELVEAECRLLDATATVAWVDDHTQLVRAARDVRSRGELLIAVTAPGTPDLTWLDADLARGTVRVDVQLREPDLTPQLLGHLQGRGIDGVRWALRTIHHHGRWPFVVSQYGSHAEQFGELRLVDGQDEAVRQPVVVLLHGGFWRSRWQLDLMDALSVDLAARGLASWNVEYRRPDRHGWAATIADVRSGLAHVGELARDFPLDPTRVAVVGHSAGGQLAVQVAGDLRTQQGAVQPSYVVQLAGLVDLIETDRRDLGNGAVPVALGGTPDEIPEVFAAASPLSRLPIGVRQLVVIGRSDSPDLREMSRRYVAAARRGGDEIELLEDDGDHFTVIDPTSRIWAQTADLVAGALRP